MAKHKVITIRVAYDEAYDVPSDEYLRAKVFSAVGDGLLSCDEADTLVETWDVDVHNPLPMPEVTVTDRARKLLHRLGLLTTIHNIDAVRDALRREARIREVEVITLHKAGGNIEALLDKDEIY